VDEDEARQRYLVAECSRHSWTQYDEVTNEDEGRKQYSDTEGNLRAKWGKEVFLF
jgi:hypothetical protein